MKVLITILLVLVVSLTSYGQKYKPDTTMVRQTELEQLVFKYINEYRVSLGKKPVKWDDNVYKVAHHEARYLSHSEIELSHYQDQDRPNHKEIVFFYERLEYFNIKCGDAIENIQSGIVLHYPDKARMEKVAKQIVEAWIYSESHREAMIQYSLKRGAVAIYRINNSWGCPVLVMCD
jgi:uncharacterized protein YkwD